MNTKLPILILVLFAVGGGALITATDFFTQERRHLARQAALLQLLQTVTPTRLTSSEPPPNYHLSPHVGGIRRIYWLTEPGAPDNYAVEVVADNGYNGPIEMLVGLNPQRQITGVRIIRHRETPGLGDRMTHTKSDWLTGLHGYSSVLAEDDAAWRTLSQGGRFDNLTGATVTANAVLNAMRTSLVHLRRQPQLLNIEQHEY